MEPLSCDKALESLEIASPCSMAWEDMTGNHQVRFCGACQLNVYNLSGMTREEAESLLQHQEGRLCVRLLRRTDGTVLTRDCPVGVRAKYKRRIKAAGWRVAAAAVLVVALYGTFTPISVADIRGGARAMPQPETEKSPKGDEPKHPGLPDIMGQVMPPKVPDTPPQKEPKPSKIKCEKPIRPK